MSWHLRLIILMNLGCDKEAGTKITGSQFPIN